MISLRSTKNITMRNVRWPIFISSYYPHAPKKSWLESPKPIGRYTPIWRNIRIINLTSVHSPLAGHIIGMPGAPVTNVLLRNVHIKAKIGMIIADARDIRFQNSGITATHGPAVIVHDAQISGISAAGMAMAAAAA
ncbi:MAG: hypothetical protein ACP5QA_00535 [Phycisphaerae bacterium]